MVFWGVKHVPMHPHIPHNTNDQPQTQEAVGETERTALLARVRALLDPTPTFTSSSTTASASAAQSAAPSSSSSSSSWAMPPRGRAQHAHMMIRRGGSSYRGQLARSPCSISRSSATPSSSFLSTALRGAKPRAQAQRKVQAAAVAAASCEDDEEDEEEWEEAPAAAVAVAAAVPASAHILVSEVPQPRPQPVSEQQQKLSPRGQRRRRASVGSEDDDNEEDEEEEKAGGDEAAVRLRAVAAFAVGGSVPTEGQEGEGGGGGGGGEGGGGGGNGCYLPPELFRELLDLLAPPWDPLRRRVNAPHPITSTPARRLMRRGVGSSGSSGSSSSGSCSSCGSRAVSLGRWEEREGGRRQQRQRSVAVGAPRAGQARAAAQAAGEEEG